MGAALVAMACQARHFDKAKALVIVPSSYGVEQMALMVLIVGSIVLSTMLSVPQIAVVVAGVVMATLLTD